MFELPPMEPCPNHKLGRHELAAVIPDDVDHDLTLFCSHCGAIRRLPVSGRVIKDRLDDLTAGEIDAHMRGQ